eukprot:TRINITY_DN116_c0_g1::TRINITY_DN116_c0_g1_i1::g.14234::m.14234 TRINITY_DN116_c0_g1::TRINITY_DN116_c0_g1_i1::g.14234  ORF type:complete len:685 (+),score=182.38,sp/Q564K3/CND2_ARATH/28.91/3e-20,Cnd2/PF05786.9/2.1e-50 TRINITY_DN116_c0_g1_i1:130-2055(+)
MCSVFDEGGAKGLLLNNIGVHNGCRLMFDSMDPFYMPISDADDPSVCANTPMDLSCLKGVFSALNRDLESLEICPQFEQFRHAKEAEVPGFDLTASDTAPGASLTRNNDTDHPSMNDYSDDDDGFCMNDDYDVPDMGGEAAPNDAQRLLDTFATLGHAAAVGSSPIKISQPMMLGGVMSGGELEYALAMAGHEGDTDNPCSYFGKAMLDAWAGPAASHWKFKTKKDKENGDEDGEGKPKRKAKTAKAPFSIDFSEVLPFDDPSYREVFKPSKEKTIQSDNALYKVDAAQFRQPPDCHYRPNSLSTLFLKPHLSVWSVRKGTGGAGQGGLISGTDQLYDYAHDGNAADFCADVDGGYDDHDDDDGNDGLLGMSKCSRNRDRDGRGEKDSDSGSSVVEVQSFWSFTGHSKSVSSTDDFALHPSQNIKYSAHSNPNTNFTPPQGNPDASVHGTVSMGVCSDSDMNVLDVRVRMLVIAACLYAMTVPVCQFVICTREAFSLDLEPLAGRVGIEDFSRFQALNAFLMVYSKFGGVFLYVPLIWAGVNSSVRGMMSAGSHQFWAGGNGVCTCVWVYFVSIALLGFHDMLCGIRRMSPYEAAFIYVALCCILALLYFALSFWWAVILSHHRARHRITRTKFYGSSKIV